MTAVCFYTGKICLHAVRAGDTLSSSVTSNGLAVSSFESIDDSATAWI
jgi:hypothetical protein